MIKQKNIFLAILNQGEISESLSKVINMMIQQDAYRIHLTYESAKPITNNRNTIVQKFLATKECDYLMMIDDDIILPPNVLKLIDFDKDIITPFMFTRQKGDIVPLFLTRNKDGIHDVGDHLNLTGLQECDATGTGCIIIKRAVLEHPEMKYPFKNEYDVDGVKTLGNDLGFCQRARKAGFSSWVHLDYVCSHVMLYDLKELFYLTLNKERLERELTTLKEYLEQNYPNILNKSLKAIEDKQLIRPKI
jgi:glycosyltransferase involved in cell wall biosynthesis